MISIQKRQYNKNFYTYQLSIRDMIKIKSNSIKSVLNRGFTFVKSNEGKIIERSKNIKINQKIHVVFKDGEKFTLVNQEIS